MQVEIAPGQEQSFDVTPTVGRGGNYMLTVYDEQGALQLMQSGALNSQASRDGLERRRSYEKPLTPALSPLRPRGEGGRYACRSCSRRGFQ